MSNSYTPARRVSLGDGAQLDAFGRLRVSQLTSQLNVLQNINALPLLVDTETGGTGTIAYDTGNSRSIMTTTAVDDFSIMQTYTRASYRAGKSQVIFITFSDFEAQTNVTKRVGYFVGNGTTPFDGSKDGIFLESTGDGVTVEVWRSGARVDTKPQAGWLDPLDGTGRSKIDVDWSQMQIIIIDFQYLGAGRIRFLIDIDGIAVLFHEFYHANRIDTPWCSSPNQPIRYEMRQTGAGSGTFKPICANVSSEGAINRIGLPHSADNHATAVNMVTAGVRYALIGIRLGATCICGNLDIKRAELLATGANKLYHWELMLNPTVAGTFTYSEAFSGAYAENAVGVSTNTVTSGTVLDGGYGSGTSSMAQNLTTARRLGSSIAGVPDEIVLVGVPFSNNTTAVASLSWEEYP